MIKTLRGLILNPALVAFARGVLEAAAMAGLMVAADFVLSADFGSWSVLVPVLTFVIRQVEGLADQIDPAKQRRRDVLANSPLTDADGNVLTYK